MLPNNNHDTTTSNPLAWTQSHSANMPSVGDEEAGADVDEPPDQPTPKPCTFHKTAIRRPSEHHSSLLTKAIRGDSDEDEIDEPEPVRTFSAYGRRRSMTSNISLASTADLTSDTGLTSPSRTNTPSPPIPEMSILRITADHFKKNLPVPAPRPIQVAKPEPDARKPTTTAATAAEAPRKRCISFVCTNGAATPKQPILPQRPTPMVKTESAQEAPRRPCIKFACAARPASTQNTPPRSRASTLESVQIPPRIPVVTVDSPSTPKKASFPTLSRLAVSPRVSPKGKAAVKPAMPARPKFLRCNSKDLVKDSSQFCEFASNEAREDDWIRQDKTVEKSKLTLDDVLVKENVIRRLAKEAEEEAEMEDEEADGVVGEDNDEDEDAEDEDDDDDVADDAEDEDDEDEDGDGDESDESDGSDGYRSDEETGFAESDDEEEDSHGLWVPGSITQPAPYSMIAAMRRPSEGEQLSDCSTAGNSSIMSVRRAKQKRVKAISPAELPDSTDFVCGTFDEDRPLEEAYMSCLEARKRQKLHVIPQDIDPSFPASEPDNEDEDDEDNGSDSEEHVWLHGPMEDIHHGQDRSRRRKKDVASPRRYHSPPPTSKARVSPQLKATRGRSPSRPQGRTSPRRLRSPAPQLLSPGVSPPHHTTAAGPAAPGVVFDITQAKSLPKPPGMFHQLRPRRHGRQAPSANMHVRGAIDIVKGLEAKRMRRKEKFLHKYCDRARKGQMHERKPQPGQGAEKMKEVGLMAGKKDQRFVISV